MSEHRETSRSGAHGPPITRPGPSPQGQELNSPQHPRRLDMNGWLTQRFGGMPPPPSSPAGTVIRPVPSYPQSPRQPPRQPGSFLGILIPGLASCPSEMGIGLEPRPLISLASLSASQHGPSGTAAPGFPPLPQRAFPPPHLMSRPTATTSVIPARRDPSASSREGTPATPIPRQPSGLESTLDAWETPPRRSRYGAKPDRGLWDLAMAAEAESLSQSLAVESIGNLNPSAGTPRTRTGRSQGAVELPDRTRSVTSARPRPAGRMPSSPSTQRREPRIAAAARAGPSADQRTRLTPGAESGDGSLTARHPGEARAMALEMVARGRSCEEVAKEYKIDASLIETWAKDKRVGPRVPRPRTSGGRFGSSRDPTQIEKRKRAMEMFAQGNSFSTVMQTLNIPRGTLSGWRYGKKEKSNTEQKRPRRAEPEPQSGTAVTDSSFRDAHSSSPEPEHEFEPAARAARSTGSGGRVSAGRVESKRTREEKVAQNPDWAEPPELGASAAAVAAASIPVSTKVRETVAGPSTQLELHNSKCEGKRKKSQFTAEIRAEALRLHSSNPSSKSVAEALREHGVKPHNVLNWVSLKRKGKMNDQGHRYYARTGWGGSRARWIEANAAAAAGVAAGQESDTTESEIESISP